MPIMEQTHSDHGRRKGGPKASPGFEIWQ